MIKKLKLVTNHMNNNYPATRRSTWGVNNITNTYIIWRQTWGINNITNIYVIW